MSGPCSTPGGDKKRHNELNELVCNVHYTCNMEEFDKYGMPAKHEYITYRLWLANRNRLRTGKTQ